MNVEQALALATELSEEVRGTTRPNPPVGCVLLDPDGRVIGQGATAPPGGPHAEIAALRAAGPRAGGATAVTTLEPCDHTGRTGPCSVALIEAGVAHVHFAAADPSPAAAGGARRLRDAGITVTSTGQDPAPLRAWLHRQRTGRPHVTWKTATSIDGRTAAADGTSRWITGPDARARVHAERARIDAIVVGTGTALADDPSLTARPGGVLAARQPLRVVVGHRQLPAGAQLLDDAAPTLFLDTHDPGVVLAALTDHPDVLLEGGATLAGAFVAAGLVDRIVAYVAPLVLGAGPAAVGDAGVGTIGDAPRFTVEDVSRVGTDVRIVMTRTESACSPE